MSLKKSAIFLGISLFLGSYAIAASTDPSLIYKNQRGSTMELTWHHNFKNTGTLSGTFTTAVGNCKADVGVPVPLLGFFNGNAMSITVNFPHCHQVVAMTGNISDDRNTLHTIWLDANQASDSRGKDWNSNLVGSDSYEKTAK